MSLVNCITSFVDGRVRLRHSALKDKDTVELISSLVAGVEGITSVQANPFTGSLLICYDPETLTRDQLLELAEQGARFIPGMNEYSFERIKAVEGESVPTEPSKTCAPVDELLSFFCDRRAGRFINRAMLVTFAASLASLPLGNRLLHTVAGSIFAGGVLQHLLAHRNAL